MYSKKQRVAALTGVILLAALYLITLISAVFAGSHTATLFRVCLVLTVAVPLLLWIYIWLWGRLTKKETIADLSILQTGDLAGRKSETYPQEDAKAPDPTEE